MLQLTPVRSVLAVPLRGAGGVKGVLTLYGERAHSFGGGEVERARALASVGGVALAAAAAEDRAVNLEIALSSSRTIATAIGVLVERHRLSVDRAFELLRQASMHTNRKLVDVARDLVESGELAREAAMITRVLNTDTPQASPTYTLAGADCATARGETLSPLTPPNGMRAFGVLPQGPARTGGVGRWCQVQVQAPPFDAGRTRSRR